MASHETQLHPSNGLRTAEDKTAYLDSLANFATTPPGALDRKRVAAMASNFRETLEEIADYPVIDSETKQTLHILSTRLGSQLRAWVELIYDKIDEIGRATYAQNYLGEEVVHTGAYLTRFMKCIEPEPSDPENGQPLRDEAQRDKDLRNLGFHLRSKMKIMERLPEDFDRLFGDSAPGQSNANIN